MKPKKYEVAASPQPEDKGDNAYEQIEEEDPHVLGLVVMVAELLVVLGLERNGVVGDVKHGKREERVVVKRILEDGVELGWDWKERGDKVVIVVVDGALELEGSGWKGKVSDKRVE
ncbi:hypothetical protein JHK82_025793 [Glycine max]|nr:hypothetical protein JHK82_025793 [Glycine max]